LHSRILSEICPVDMPCAVYVGLATMVLTVPVGSLASFAVGRMRLAKARPLTNAALLTYVLPSSFLAIPFLGVRR
jgi:multiple sugar transport system permease protein